MRIVQKVGVYFQRLRYRRTGSAPPPSTPDKFLWGSDRFKWGSDAMRWM